MFEPLELRRLLSAELVDGLLLVEGTEGDDSIKLDFSVVVTNSIPGSVYTSIVVMINGEYAGGFDATQVRAVLVLMEAGDDQFESDIFGNYYTGQEPQPRAFCSILGSAGNDLIETDSSSRGDFVVGGTGRDTVMGGSESDTILGGRGDDYLVGYAYTGPSGPQDILRGGRGNDIIEGSSGDDRITGGRGDDLIRARAGQDSIRPGLGDDSVYAGTGDDSLRASFHSDGSDLLRGGDGIDSMSYARRGNIAVRVSLDNIANDGQTEFLNNNFNASQTPSDSEADNVFSDIEILIGTDGTDNLRGGSDAETLVGGWGNDSLHGNGGDDQLFGNGGDDFIHNNNSDGHDTIQGGRGEDFALFIDNNADVLVSIEVTQFSE